MALEQKLKEIGLTPNEIRLYLALLEKGGATPPQLAQALSLPRSNIHYLLQHLVEKGFARKQAKGKRYSPMPPRTPPWS
jgi:sugar-specific transcriptional regulator TrmB